MLRLVPSLIGPRLWTQLLPDPHNRIMAETQHSFHRQEWFMDPRSPERRMRMTWHSEERLAVLSLWKGSECRGTFRLPAAEAARLVGALANGLAESWSSPVAPPSTPPRPRFGALRRWFKRGHDSATPLTLIHGG